MLEYPPLPMCRRLGRFFLSVFCAVALAVSGTARAGVVISEFLASNENGLLDENGDTSDWIELYNDGASAVDLTGWTITDDAGTPGKWVFPAVTLAPKGFLIVFASEKNRAVAGAPLHTNFKLSADGGYLGLFQPGGALAHEFDPYPGQYADKPYGTVQTVSTTQLVGANGALRYRIPTNNTLGTTWTARTFSDVSWPAGTNGIGYESTTPGWAFKVVFSNSDIPDLTQAEAVLVTPGLQASVQQGNHPVVNFDNSGSQGHYTPDNPPSWLPADRELFVVEAKGTVTIPAAGTWTFGVMSDDGCSLQIRPVGGAYTTVLSFAGLRGMNDSLGTHTFATAGEYEVRVVIFENYGGAGGEVFAKQGSAGAWDSTFKVIGDTVTGGLAVKSVPVGTGGSGYTAQVGTNVQAAMQNVSPSAYIRYSFSANPAALTSLTMPIKYDDGFIAWLNGTEVARRNAPAGTPSNTTAALGDRMPLQALTNETIDLTPFLAQLINGTNVLAVQGLNQAANDGDFLIRPQVAQYQVTAGAANFFTTATPGGFNTSPVYNKVAPVIASVGRGFFTTAQSVTLSTGTTGTTIRYTFDGSTPSLASATSATYTGPISITGTKTLRYAAFRSGFDPSDVVTQTYIFPADVLTQSPTGDAPVISNPAGATQATTTWPTGPVNGQVLNYGMDPDIVNNPTWSATLVDDLKSIPTFSVVTDLGNLFDPANGIYVNPGADGIVWERPASVELINPDGTTGFQINCGLRLRGGFSRSGENPKHAFRLFFRDTYGPGKLQYPLFGDAPGAADEFDKFDLRCAQNYSWSFQGDSGGIFIRDVVARDMQLATGQPSSHGGFYHLYVNGQYWGLYNIDERPDANFGASYLGGNDDDYDAIKVDPDLDYSIEATDGNTDAWAQLWQLADTGLAGTNSEAANNTTYQRLIGNNPDGTPNAAYPVLLDPVNTIDSMLVVYWGGNLDAQISAFLGNEKPNNSFWIRNRLGASGGFKSILHDSEHTMLNLNEDRTGPWIAGSSAAQPTNAFSKSTPQYVFQQCIVAEEFKTLFADRTYRHCFNGGALTPTRATAIFDARKNEIDRAVVAESARWGDSKTEPPLTRDNWLSAIGSVRNSYLPARTAVLIAQLRAKGWYPAFDPPVLSPRGGTVAPGSSVTVTAGNGTPGGSIIYFTDNGTDPRLFGGGVNPAAQTILSGGTIVINTSKVIRVRTRSGSVWSALEEAAFYVTQDYTPLALTEIHFRPPGSGAASDDYEFLELKNTGTSALDLGGLTFTAGITYTFPAGTTIAPGGFFVLARKASTFLSRYGFNPNAVFAAGGLNNSGETLTLSHSTGGTVLSVEYKDTAPWPAAADGQGFTVVPAGTIYNSDDGRDWRASAAVHGSPGADDPAVNFPPIVINEVLSNSTLPLRDTIELRNPTASAVNVGDWWLTDDPGTPQKYRIPAGTTIPAGGHIVFDETQFNATPGVAPSFALGSTGDDVYVFSGNAGGALTGYSHGLDFAGAENDVSFGRYVNSVGDEQFPRQIARTFGSANAGPLVGPLVIAEVMYHPYPGYDEYIEIRNISGNAVNLYDPANPANTWKVGGLNYSFPTGNAIPAGALALVVGIDPATFRTKYNVPVAVQIFGPYTGGLQNSGERLSLEMPGVPVVEGAVTTVPFIVIDTVRYNDKLPWPVAADGGGPSLQRLQIGVYADDPINWFANGATPGLENAQNQLPTVAITAPANNSSYTIPATVTFQATASDPDGSIVEVEYFVDGNKVGDATVAPYTFAWTATGGVHTVTARAIDSSLGISTSTPISILVTTPVTQGLRAQYFVNAENFINGPAGIRIDPTVNFSKNNNWPSNTGFPGITNDNYSVRWTGQFRPPSSGSYTFYINSDDGSFLYLNDVLVISNGGYHGDIELGYTTTLTAGQLYKIQMDMFQGGGGATAQLSYSGPAIAKQIIPQARLYPDSAPIVITQPVSISREQGTSATFTVLASGIGNSYQWRKGGVNIPGANAATYTLTDLWASDAGAYSVIVSNTGGFALSSNANLTVTFTDSDGDGMQNSWETANGFSNSNAADAALDADKDGKTNLEEFRAGTNPNDSKSLLAAVIEKVGADSYRIRFTAMPNKGYSIQYRTALTSGAWQKLTGADTAAQRGGSPRVIEIVDTAPPGQARFYQVVTPQLP